MSCYRLFHPWGLISNSFKSSKPLNTLQADVGVYTCEANNEMGKVFAVLNIEDNENLPDEVDDVVMNDDAGVLKRIEYEIEKELESVSTATSPTVNLVILALIGMLLKLWMIRKDIKNNSEFKKKRIFNHLLMPVAVNM